MTSEASNTVNTTNTAPAAQPSLRHSALSGSAWTLAGFGLSQILRLGSNIILAALLFEEAFALMAIVMAIMQGLAMFSDLGLSPSVVQNQRGDERDFLDTAWTLQVIRGVALTAIACALAWPVAAFYAANDPMAWQLLGLLPLVALTTLVAGFQSSNLMSATRHLNLGRATMIELGSQIVSLSVMVTVAWWTRSVYSLAVGAVVGSVLHCTLTHIVLSGQRNRFRWEPAAVRSIIHFGKWIFVATIISFFALQIDRLVFAKLFPLSEVGVYAIAASVAAMTPMLLGRLQNMIAFPLYSRMLARNEKLDIIVRRSKLPMLAVGGYLVALSIAGAQTFVDLAYDHRYAMAGLYIAILASGAWFAIIDGIYGAAFLAIGKSRWVALVNFVKVLAFLALLLPTIRFAGFVGAVFAVAASDLIKLFVAFTCARSIDLKNQGTDILWTLYVFTIGLSTLWITQYGTAIATFQSPIKLMTQFFMVSIAFAPPLLFAARAILRPAVPATDPRNTHVNV